MHIVSRVPFLQSHNDFSMELTLTTPAVLFGSISLILLAYTNRFLSIASIIRQLKKNQNEYKNKANLSGQILNLRRRLKLIRNMQLTAVLAFFFCVLSMALLYLGFAMEGGASFFISITGLLISLAISIREIWISTRALDIELSDMDILRKG